MIKNETALSSFVGAYFWAGPGTIRLLQTKYHSPHIDHDSFLTTYDLPYLIKLKNLFGITDAWVTYSWGFSDQTEQVDYLFMAEKLSNFKKLGIRTHAYIQGLNVVTKEFANQSFFCVDHWGHRQPYSKGRSLICPNHPQTKKLIAKRVTRACKEDVDGIFIDNILFGFPPLLVRENWTSFFGCACHYCQKKFQDEYCYSLPKVFDKKQLDDYLTFREKSVNRLVKSISQLVHKQRKTFGVNLYDPVLRNDRLYFGYHLEKVEPFLDYLLIENHSLPRSDINNTHLIPLIKKTKKPIFVVSYQEGIGFEPQYTQQQISNIFSEAKQFNYSPCLKVTEYTTDNTWHCLYLDNLEKPNLSKKIFPYFHIKKTKKREAGVISKIIWNAFQPLAIPAISFTLNNQAVSNLTRILHKELIRRI